MDSLSIWSDFGFTDNPYNNRNLRGDEVGARLLVGRGDEAKRLKRGIASGGTFPTVEGPTGAGKTSLVSVASYELYWQTCVRNSGALYVPLPKTLQLAESADEFEQRVYRDIAQALIAHFDDFEHVGLPVPRTDFAHWLNSPDYKTFGAQVAGFGANGGERTEHVKWLLRVGIRANGQGRTRSMLPERRIWWDHLRHRQS